MTNIYQTGETVRLSAAITDSTGTAVDPTTVVISIAKPDGTLDVTGAAMTNDPSAVGAYYYDYTISASIGTYKVQIKATGTGDRITITQSLFTAEAAI